MPKAPTSGRPADRPKVPVHVRVLLAYAVLAVAMTWPLAAHLTTQVPMGDNDLWQNYWNFWWWKEALVERHQSPYTTDLLFHPEGAALGLHTHSEANQIAMLPVGLALGPAAALDLSILAGFALAGFGAWLLAREYVPGAGAPFLAGILYAFFPNHVEHSLEHVNLASLHGLPFFLWALVRTARHGGRHWVPLGLFFAINALLGWHNALLAIPLGLAVLGYEARHSARPLRTLAGDLIKGAVLAGVILAPFFWPMLRDATEQVGYFRKGVAPRSIDPLFLLIPHASHPLWGSLFSELYEKWRTYTSVGFIGYAGLSALALAAASFLGRRDGTREGDGRPRDAAPLWCLSAVFFLLLSFGSTLTVAGREYPGVPMLFGILEPIPFIGRVRVPHRFLTPAMLCLAMLVATGASRLLERIPMRRRALATALAAGLLLLDLLWLPYPVQPVPSPPWIRVLSSFTPGLAVLDIPGGHRARGADDMFLQTLHGRPIAGGYVSIPLRQVSRRLRRYPVLRKVFQSSSGDSDYEGPDLVRAVEALDVGIVVVHLDRTAEALRARREQAAREHPGDPYRLLPFNPAQGMPRALLDRFRSELRSAYGDPVHRVEGVVEIYRVDGS